MNSALIDKTIRHAINILTAQHPRSRYAADVLRGRQAWSGADLTGNAKRWGASYKRQRDAAEQALMMAGGTLVYAGRSRRKVAAVPVGQDDWGNAIYQTTIGPARTGKRWNVDLY